MTPINDFVMSRVIEVLSRPIVGVTLTALCAGSLVVAVLNSRGDVAAVLAAAIWTFVSLTVAQWLIRRVGK